MNFLQKLSPGYTPRHVAEQGELLVLRERFLQAILLLYAVIGLPLSILGSQEAAQGGNYALQYLYYGLYSAYLLIALVREIPYVIRGNSVVLLMLILAFSEIFESGQLGEIRMMLIVFCSLTALLFNLKNVIAAIVVGVLTIGFAAAASSLGIIAPLQGTEWLTSLIMFVALSTTVAGSITFLLSGMNESLKKQAQLANELQVERNALESRVQERTQALARQVNQIQTAAEISKSISALNDPDALLPHVVELMKERFNLYYVGIFLVDTLNQEAVLRAGSGDAGRQMLAERHHLALGGNSMIGWCIANKQPRIALDAGEDAVRFSNPHLPLTRSELALPIIAHGQALGAMTVQSEQPNAFNENDITVLQSIADSLAIALENDQLFQETSRSLEEIRTLNHEYLQRAWAEALDLYGSLSYDYQNPQAEVENQETYSIQVPLILRNETIGFINLEMDRPALSDEDTAFIESVTSQTAVALENARLLYETERRAMQEQKLNELSTRFSRAIRVDEILKTAAQELGQLPAVAEVSVQLKPMSGPARTGLLAEQPERGNGKEHAR
ncbi:MAG: GAF domain-containing protein [Chloroflexi bacterium]|nr:GAF domain-containing protein [Chloroflexota bacterium]